MRDCEHCEKYKLSDSGYYMCSSWNCIQDEKPKSDDKDTVSADNKRA